MPAHGQLAYLQLPALDVRQSAAFYAAIFGWHVEADHPSFDGPGLFGQWITDRLAAPTTGPVLWLQVERIDDALKLVEANGGQVVEQPFPDGTERWLATIRDPAGNVLGLVQNAPR
jgi:predicted enzyme related to lactoylglutathione lyase